MTKKTRFAFRTTEEFKKRVTAIAKKLNLPEAVIGEAALEAVVSHVEQYGELTIPIRLAPPKHFKTAGELEPPRPKRHGPKKAVA